MIGRLINEVTSNKKSSKIINGTVILMKKTAFGSLLDVNASTIDSIFELLGNAVTLQLVSADNADPANGNGGKLGKLEELENWNLTFTPPLTGQDSLYKVSFEWDEELGTPGAIILRNNHASEFFLKTITLDDVPGAGQIHFLCNSWVYPDKHYKKPRVFFSNKTYLPHETPATLRKYREEELIELRGDGKAELKEGDRVYDYAVYNDLGDPDKDAALARPVLGGSTEFPYPRRGRTSRPPSRSDPNTESRRFLPASLFNVYVPRDEQFGHLKMSDFIAFNLKGVVNNILPLLQDFVDLSVNEFDSFEEVDNLYFNGIRFPTALGSILSKIPLPMMNEIFRTDGGQLFKFPVPQVIQDRSKPTAWRTDEEFGREMLAGVNPLLILLLKEFPPTSKLDPEVYGDQASSITKEDIEYNLEGISVEEALASNRLFMLDHHDPVIPYLRRINSDTGTKAHASRTILFLRGDRTLKPVAIELSTPHPDGDKFGVVSKVYTPAEHGIEGSIWQFAKAFVAVNDCGYHQLISHWLNTHAVLEPFIIATNRQLSVVHPVYKLLHPHYRDTMTINALAREVLVNADGIMETTFFQAKYCLEFSSHIYKSWNFLEQALPTDLKKRGVAVDDGDSPHGLRLLIKDYPYAVDGLNIWFALEKWVRDYCSFYYKSNEMVQEDPELQAWWKELREVGHGDKKDEPWWPKMQTLEELIESCTTIIWIASALHAAVNFGQYAYEGYSPNRPTLSRRLMPEKDTPEYAELEKNPEKAFFRTMTSQLQCLTGMTVVEVLSKHPSDEVYLGQRDDNWTTDATPLAAFQAFNNRLREVEEEIINLNMDKKLKNRVGPVNVAYTLLFPSGEVGLSGKGIPNSISI